MAILPLLYRVQEIESRLAVLERSLNQLKGNANLAALRLLQTEVAQNIAKSTDFLKQLKTRETILELDVKTNQEHVKQEEGKLYSGTVVNSRELGLVQQKVEEYRVLLEKAEDALLTLMEDDEARTEELNRLNERQTVVAQEMAKLQGDLKQQSVELLLEKDQLQMELEELLPQISPEWIEKYRRIAKSHRGVGIAKLKDHSCGACHVSLSDSKLQQAKRGEDKLNFCENCGRILYYN